MATKDFEFNDGDEGQQFDWAERFHYYRYLVKILLRKYWWILLLTTSIGVFYQTY